jgi:hypothetical protein
LLQSKEKKCSPREAANSNESSNQASDRQALNQR